MIVVIGKMHGKSMEECVVFNLRPPPPPAPASKPLGACFGSSWLLGVTCYDFNLSAVGNPKTRACNSSGATDGSWAFVQWPCYSRIEALNFPIRSRSSVNADNLTGHRIHTCFIQSKFSNAWNVSQGFNDSHHNNSNKNVKPLWI